MYPSSYIAGPFGWRVPCYRPVVRGVYLLHFESKLSGHAGHYVGYSENLAARIAAHEAGDSAKIIEACSRNGIRFVVSRVWVGGDRELERKIKRGHNAPRRYCPICRGLVHVGYSVDIRQLTARRSPPVLATHQGKRRPMRKNH
jgi:predicted GIY-YIG superfamily endonuclease